MTCAHRFLDDLPAAARERLVTSLETVALPRGHALQSVGERPRYVYFVTQGLVSLLAMTPDGGSLELALVGCDGLIGLAVLLRSRAPTYQAVVQLAGTALRARADAITTALHDHAAVRDACLQYADASLADVAQSTVCHHFHPLLERLCRWLLTASDRARVDSLDVTHDTLAQVLGVPRPAITAAAMDLHRAHAIRGSRGRIEIVNRQRLEHSACSCYAATRDAFVLTPPPVAGRPLRIASIR